MNTFVKYYCNERAQHAYFYIKSWLSKHKKHQTAIVLVFFFILALLISTAFMLVSGTQGLPEGDYIFHNTRFVGILQNILHGHYPLVSQYVGCPGGLATPAFYPWLTMLPIVLLRDILSPISAFFVTVTMIYFVGYLTAYFSYKTYDSSSWHSFIFSLIYTSSITALQSTFFNGGISNTLAIMLFPMAIFGMIPLLKYGHWRMLTCGVVLVGYTHLISLTLLSVFLLIMLISFIKKLDIHKIIRLVYSVAIGILALSPVIAPVFILSSKNSIAYPTSKVPGGFAAGLFSYGDNNPIALILPGVALTCMGWFHSRYSKVDIFMIATLVLSIIINIQPIGGTLAKVLPAVKAIQFSNRLSVFGIFATAWLVMKYFRYHVKPINYFILMNKFLVLLLIAVLPLAVLAENGLSYHKLPAFKKYSQRTELVRGHQLRTSNRMYSSLAQEPVYLDYSPKKSTNYDDVYVHRLIYTAHRGKTKVLPGKTVGTNPDIIAEIPHAEHNIFLPIVLYHGIKYQFMLNGHRISNKQVNQKLTWRYQKLCLKRLPAGSNRIRIQSAKLEI